MALTTFEQTRPPLPVRVLNRYGDWLGSTPSSATKLIAIAKRRCRLDDFGGGEFFEPLSRLLESCQHEARLNVVGKIALRVDVVRTLCNRLAMEKDRQLYPDTAYQEIREPLFIVGLPRSGTTLLHILLAADPQHRAPLTWEVMTPSPPTNRNERQRIRRAARNLSSLRWLAPMFENVHALGPAMPQECVSLMSPTFLSDQFDTMYNVPSYRRWFLNQDMQPVYAYHRRFLQHLQQRRRARRWILKAPAHMSAAPALLSVYCEARFVQVHRDPLEAITSVSSLIAILRSVFSDDVDLRDIGCEAWRYWSTTMAIFLRERDRLPAQRTCDIHYTEIQRDPMSAIRRIYEHFDWMLSQEAEQRMRIILANQPQQQRGNHRYDPAQFGFDASAGAGAFTAYCERFGLSTEGDRTRGGRAPRLVST